MTQTFHWTPTFEGGVHPDDHKEATAGLPIERMPFVERYVLILGQHIGAPSRPVVGVGQRVERGQLVAEPGGFVSTSLHSPVTGRVAASGSRYNPMGRLVPALEIEADPYSSQRLATREPLDWEAMSLQELVDTIQRAGLVGMGGAAFPSHVKFAVPEGKTVKYLVINGCECEPYLTCDHRLMVERAEAVVRGIEITAARLGVERTVIGVEANKTGAVEALLAAAPPGLALDVQALPVKYPQGAEKMLIRALFGLEVPAGKLPMDIGMVVNNVGTMAALADYVDHGQPLIERIVTVSGPAVRRPANLLVPVGTPVRQVLEHCGGLTEEAHLVVMGGPMMGMPLTSLDVPVQKGTSGILAFTEAEVVPSDERPCIKCARCLEACPSFLNPSRLGRLSRLGRYDTMEADQELWACMDCGACSFACPSNIPLVQLIRVAKSALRDRKAKK